MSKHLWLDSRFNEYLEENSFIDTISELRKFFVGYQSIIEDKSIKAGDQLIFDMTSNISSRDQVEHILKRIVTILKVQSEQMFVMDPDSVKYSWKKYKEELIRLGVNESDLKNRDDITGEIIKLSSTLETRNFFLDFERNLKREFHNKEFSKEKYFKLKFIYTIKQDSISKNIIENEYEITDLVNKYFENFFDKNKSGSDKTFVGIGFVFENRIGNSLYYFGSADDVTAKEMYYSSMNEYLCSDSKSLVISPKDFLYETKQHEFPVFSVDQTTRPFENVYRYKLETFKDIITKKPLISWMLAEKNDPGFNEDYYVSPKDPFLPIENMYGNPYSVFNRFPKNGFFLSDLSEESIKEKENYLKQFQSNQF